MGSVVEVFELFIAGQGVVVLLIGAAIALFFLTRAADGAVDSAVALARAGGVPPVVIGATVVSVGTTLPEVAVSVVAAAGGDSALAVGNATGSIVANIALIGGLLLILTRTPLDGYVARRSTLLALAAVGVLGAVVMLTRLIGTGAGVPRAAGVGLVVLLPLYLVVTVRRKADVPMVVDGAAVREADTAPAAAPGLALTAAKLLLATAVVVVSSRVLLPIVVELARRVGLPESLIAATLVAIGTSLPELSTSIAAARKGEAELGLGNIAGANVMNVLLVVGLSAVVSSGGLALDRYLFTQMVPAAVGFSGVLVLVVIFHPRTLPPTRVVGGALLLAYAGLVAVGLLGI